MPASRLIGRAPVLPERLPEPRGGAGIGATTPAAAPGLASSFDLHTSSTYTSVTMAHAPERIRIMFVCLGNICRSPLAEGVFRAHVEAAGLSGRFEIRSSDRKSVV